MTRYSHFVLLVHIQKHELEFENSCFDLSTDNTYYTVVAAQKCWSREGMSNIVFHGIVKSFVTAKLNTKVAIAVQPMAQHKP